MSRKFISTLLAACFAIALAGFSLPAHAQQATPSSIAAARELLTLLERLKMFDPVVPGIIEQAKNNFMQQNPMLQKDLNETAATLRAQYATRKEELSAEIAKLYAQRFTEAELKELIVFYKTPLGRKLVKEEPVFVDQTMSYAQDWANKLSEQVIISMRAEMKKKGHDI